MCFNDFLDQIGYIMHVGENVHSKKGNSYFDVTVKTSAKINVTMRVMKKTNLTIHRDFFMKKIQKAVLLRHLSKSGETYFYNSYYGSWMEDARIIEFKHTDVYESSVSEIKSQSTGTFSFKAALKWIGKEKQAENGKTLREAIIIDADKNILPITVWQETINKCQDYKVHHFTNCTLKFYFSVQKLATTKFTQVTVTDDTFDINWNGIEITDWCKLEQDEKLKLFPCIKATDIIGCSVKIFPKCTSCNKQVSVPDGEKRFSCSSCHQRLISAKLPIGFSGEIDINTDTGIIKLTFFPEVLTIFGDNVLEQFSECPEDLEDKILDQTGEIDITYSDARKVITEIVQHEEIPDVH